MKRSEFVPGVLFHLPGSTFSVYVYRVLGEKTHGIEQWGYLTKEGNLIENREKQFYHLDFKRNGLQLWQVTASVYLQSKTLPFEVLTKVEQPIRATNPISI